MSLSASILVFAIGLCIGSFLNVCIYRIPKGKSIVFPPSACPNCGKHLQFYELVPVLSYLIQKGRCRGCDGKISWRYPAIELLSGLLLLWIVWRFGWSYLAVHYSIFLYLLIVVSMIDIDHKIIPNVVVIPGALLGLLMTTFGNHYITGFCNGLLGMVVGFFIIAVVIVLSRGGMGWGDAKLLAMIGAFLGWQATLYSLFVGSLFGSTVGVAMILSKRMERKTPIPFGPFLGLGALGWLVMPWWF